MRLFVTIITKISTRAVLTLTFAVVIWAQSSDRSFPTPVSSNEITGTIKARDIGDSRTTSYFYTFDGGQGDIFINVVTRNFSGDIDVFTADALQPLTKMVIYADAGINETGRVIYLRKGARLVLRVEGRSPNDDPASFRIKFAGSFVALAEQKTESAPSITSSGQIDETGVTVNSVGTIIAIPPKPKTIRKSDEGPKVPVPSPKPETTAAPEILNADRESIAVEKVVVDKKTDIAAESESETKSEVSAVKPETRRAVGRTKTPKPLKSSAKVEEKKPDPLASIRLVIQLKDGQLIEHRMDQVLKFSVDKGVLTVISKDGNIRRYSLLDVAKVTIE